MLMCLLSPIAHRKPVHRAATMRSIFICALLLCSCISCSAQAYRDLTRTKALSIRDSDALAASDAALPAGSTLQLALVVFRCAQHGEGRMSCCMLLLLQRWWWWIWQRAALVRASSGGSKALLHKACMSAQEPFISRVASKCSCWSSDWAKRLTAWRPEM